MSKTQVFALEPITSYWLTRFSNLLPFSLTPSGSNSLSFGEQDLLDKLLAFPRLFLYQAFLYPFLNPTFSCSMYFLYHDDLVYFCSFVVSRFHENLHSCSFVFVCIFDRYHYIGFSFWVFLIKLSSPQFLELFYLKR